MPLITFRLYPSDAQRQRLETVTEVCRLLYNACLEERWDAYPERGETIGLYAQLRRVKKFKAAKPIANGVHSHCLQIAVADLDKPGCPIWIRPTGAKAVEMLAKLRIPSFTRRVRQDSAT